MCTHKASCIPKITKIYYLYKFNYIQMHCPHSAMRTQYHTVFMTCWVLNPTNHNLAPIAAVFKPLELKHYWCKVWWNFIYVPLSLSSKFTYSVRSINFIFSWNYTLSCIIITVPHAWLFHFKQPWFTAWTKIAVYNKMTSCSFSAIRPVYNSTYVMELHTPPVQNHWSRSL